MKAFKISKVLRLISRNEGLKVALYALVQTIPEVIKVSLIMFLFYSMFAVVIIRYFSGFLFICTGTVIGEPLDKWECLS
jgi:hypothetical protein